MKKFIIISVIILSISTTYSADHNENELFERLAPAYDDIELCPMPPFDKEFLGSHTHEVSGALISAQVNDDAWLHFRDFKPDFTNADNRVTLKYIQSFISSAGGEFIFQQDQDGQMKLIMVGPGMGTHKVKQYWKISLLLNNGLTCNIGCREDNTPYISTCTG